MMTPLSLHQDPKVSTLQEFHCGVFLAQKDSTVAIYTPPALSGHTYILHVTSSLT